jgi:hypothetical protein
VVHDLASISGYWLQRRGEDFNNFRGIVITIKYNVQTLYYYKCQTNTQVDGYGYGRVEASFVAGFGVVVGMSIDISSPLFPLYFDDLGPNWSSC